MLYLKIIYAAKNSILKKIYKTKLKGKQKIQVCLVSKLIDGLFLALEF